MIGLNENIEVLHKYSKIEFCYKRLAIKGLISLLYCNTANLEMLDWSYRWKIRTDIVACESTCILY